MEPIQKHKHTIGAMEVLYFDQAELQKTKGNKTSFASMGPLSVLYFKKADRFVLRLNDWMYPLMSKLPITRCDKGGMKEMMLEMPALNGFTYKLKIMGELNPNLMSNMEMILSHCCGLMDQEKKMMNQEMMSPTMKMSGEESPEKMEMSERAMRTMKEAKETIQMIKERAMAKATDIMSRRKMLDLKMMKNRDFRMEAKSRIKDYCMQSEKATQEFMNMRKMNPNLTQARSLEELKKMDAKMPMMFIRREELDMAMINNREIVNPGTKKAAMVETKKMMEEKMGTGMTSQRTPQKKSSVLGWFKKSLSGIKDAFDDMMGKSTGKSMTDLTDQDLMKSSPEREKMMPQEKEPQGEVHDTNYMKIDNPIPLKTEMPREQRNEQRMPMRQGQERRNQPRGGMMEEKMPEMMMEGGMEHYQG